MAPVGQTWAQAPHPTQRVAGRSKSLNASRLPGSPPDEGPRCQTRCRPARKAHTRYTDHNEDTGWLHPRPSHRSDPVQCVYSCSSAFQFPTQALLAVSIAFAFQSRSQAAQPPDDAGVSPQRVNGFPRTYLSIEAAACLPSLTASTTVRGRAPHLRRQRPLAYLSPGCQDQHRSALFNLHETFYGHTGKIGCLTNGQDNVIRLKGHGPVGSNSGLKNPWSSKTLVHHFAIKRPLGEILKGPHELWIITPSDNAVEISCVWAGISRRFSRQTMSTRCPPWRRAVRAASMATFYHDYPWSYSGTHSGIFGATHIL